VFARKKTANIKTAELGLARRFILQKEKIRATEYCIRKLLPKDK
jgi:hypothetical protein